MSYEGYRYVRSYGADFSRDPRKDKSKPAWGVVGGSGRTCAAGWPGRYRIPVSRFLVSRSD